jgi:hypothetical protein
MAARLRSLVEHVVGRVRSTDAARRRPERTVLASAAENRVNDDPEVVP